MTMNKVWLYMSHFQSTEKQLWVNTAESCSDDGILTIAKHLERSG